MHTRRDQEKLIRKKRILALLSVIIALGVFVFLTYYLAVKFWRIGSSAEEFKLYIDSFGNKGRFAALGIQTLQVVIALLPGELIEIGVGYAFGAVEGTILCLLGVAAGSAIIFLLTKKLGVRLVELFVSTQKINDLRFINSEKKLHRLIFILFFIPGTPKDLLTYFVGLTRMKLHEFLIISSIARLPSVLSSTIGGDLIGDARYAEAVLLFTVTGLVSLCGIGLYNWIVKKYRQKHEKGQEG